MKMSSILNERTIEAMDKNLHFRAAMTNKLPKFILLTLTLPSIAFSGQNSRIVRQMNASKMTAEISKNLNSKDVDLERLKTEANVQLEKFRRINEKSDTQPTSNKIQSSGGIMDGGGGQAILLKSGRALFVDMIADPVDSSLVVNSNQTRELLYNSDGQVRKIAKDLPNFFSCGQTKLRAQSFFSLKWLAKEVDNIHPLSVEFRLIGLDKENLGGKLQNFFSDIPAVSNPSPSFQNDIQEPVASYQKSRLWISRRVYDRMSNEDQCALQVHESLRHLNRVMKGDVALSTSDIEKLTRYVMGKEANAPAILETIENQFLDRDPEAHYFMALEMLELFKRMSSKEEMFTDKEYEGLAWEVFNAASDLNASSALGTLQRATSAIDQISSTKAMAVEMYMKETNVYTKDGGLWDATTGYRFF